MNKNLKNWTTVLFVVFLVSSIAIAGNELLLERQKSQSEICVPIAYPGGELLTIKTHETFIMEHGKSIGEIAKLFYKQLQPIPFDNPAPYKQGEWRVQPTRDTGLLFDCYGSIDMLSVATGCIFLHENGDETIVEYSWTVGELASGCQSQYPPR